MIKTMAALDRTSRLCSYIFYSVVVMMNMNYINCNSTSIQPSSSLPENLGSTDITVQDTTVSMSSSDNVIQATISVISSISDPSVNVSSQNEMTMFSSMQSSDIESNIHLDPSPTTTSFSEFSQINSTKSLDILSSLEMTEYISESSEYISESTTKVLPVSSEMSPQLTASSTETYSNSIQPDVTDTISPADSSNSKIMSSSFEATFEQTSLSSTQYSSAQSPISSTSEHIEIMTTSSIYISASDNYQSSESLLQTETIMISGMVTEPVTPSTSLVDTVQSSLTSDMSTSSSAPQTTNSPTIATTLPTTSTTKLPLEKNKTIDSSNVFKIRTDLTIINCDNLTSVELRDRIMKKKIDDLRNVIVLSFRCGSRRKKRSVEKNGDAEIEFQVEVGVNPKNFVNSSYTEIMADINFNLTYPDTYKSEAEKTLNDPCNTDVCDEFVGYICANVTPTDVTCTNRCNRVTCSNHGECHIKLTGGNTFATHCVCQTENYYKYEGEQCENKRMKWELAVAIGGGAAGGIILILVFALIVCCCCKASKDDQYAYRRDSYEPMSQFLAKPGSGPAYYRNDGNKSHQTGLSNFGYEDDTFKNDFNNGQRLSTDGGSWNPDDSKDTYAKISQQLERESNFQIKRPQISGSTRQSMTAEATTGF